MTETSGCVTTLPDGEDDHVGSSGMLIPSWEAMVVDLATKQPLPPLRKGSSGFEVFLSRKVIPFCFHFL